MKKKGFTLIELLAVITILGLIGLIAIPSITKVLKNSKAELYNVQVKMIKSNARKWAVENFDQLSEVTNTYLSLNDLINSGYIEQSKLKDPRDNKDMNGCIVISYNNSENKYVYNYSDEECSIDNILLTHKLLENNPGADEYTEVSDEYYFISINPNNWLLFGKKLWRVLKTSDEGIKIIFERSCTGNTVDTCTGTENGNISEITDIIYSNAGGDGDLPSNKWNNQPNYMKQGLDQWYDEANFNELYIKPIKWCIGAMFEAESLDSLRNEECSSLSDTISGSGDYDAYTTDESPIGTFRISDIMIPIDFLIPYFYEGDNNEELAEFYLYKNYSYLTMTASADYDSYYDSYSYWGMYNEDDNGTYGIDFVDFSSLIDVRPIVNLKANVTYKGGVGSESNPYIIE